MTATGSELARPLKIVSSPGAVISINTYIAKLTGMWLALGPLASRKRLAHIIVAILDIHIVHTGVDLALGIEPAVYHLPSNVAAMSHIWAFIPRSDVI